MSLPEARSAATTSEEWAPGRLVRLLSTAFGGLSVAAVALAGVATIGHWTPTHGAPVAVAAAATGAATANTTREFTLEAKEVDWELMPGTTVKAWTYNGQMPGPELRVTEGDLVRVTLKNSLPVPTTLHWHGVDVPNNMDGVPGMTQDAVPPGGTFTYEFVATNPGTRWYHSHQDPEIQDALGLYGPLIIEPKTPPAGEPVYNREYTYMLGEWSLAMTPQVAMGQASLPQSGPGAPHAKEPDYDLFLMNGHANEDITPLVVNTGERIRVRLINAGSLVHVMHTHGHSFKVIALDGNPLPPAAQYVKDSVMIGPSERVDIELLANNPGVWMFHCHIEHHMANGMMTTVRYEGMPAPGGQDHAMHMASPSAAPAASAPAAGQLPAAQDVPAAAQKIVLVDNRFQPTMLTVPAGTTVAWINNGANLHTVSALDGGFESGSIPPGKAFVYTFTKPGTYQYLCRQHFLNGMSGSITVQ